MNELPPDPARLRAILAWLDQQLADTETVAVYLRLQRDAVQQALTQAGTPATSRVQEPTPPHPAAVPTPAQNPRRPGKPYALERVKTADGPVPTTVHMADCHMAGELVHKVNAMEARLALTDSGLAACGFCRPDTELGIDVD